MPPVHSGIKLSYDAFRALLPANPCYNPCSVCTLGNELFKDTPISLTHALLCIQQESLSLELSSNDSYEEVSRHLASALTPPLDDPSHLRFTQQNNYTQQPKPQPLRFPHQEMLLPDMLVHFGQTSDTLYYEVLDLPLQELEQLKTLKASKSLCSMHEALCLTTQAAFPGLS